mmetsp:Transcript_16644/g.34154  ORF Transcript_16644/g.34154 Transcript_16644/m.34154 type:complete len:126 (-) Transcript_16644:2908-3285(-)
MASLGFTGPVSHSTTVVSVPFVHLPRRPCSSQRAVNCKFAFHRLYQLFAMTTSPDSSASIFHPLKEDGGSDRLLRFLEQSRNIVESYPTSWMDHATLVMGNEACGKFLPTSCDCASTSTTTHPEK